MSLEVTLIPALADNYIYRLTCTETGINAIIDPAESAPVLHALGDDELDVILLTHHHDDHTAGTADLVDAYDCPVLGSQKDADDGRLPMPLSRGLSNGDVIAVGNHTATVLFMPGHTSGHIAFHFEDDAMLFCGDVLFAGGCGRIFDGTPEEMFIALQRIKAMPDHTQLYCGHEYTVGNLSFAHELLPENNAITERLAHVIKLQQAGTPTLPTTVAEEKETNVFLMADTLEDFINPRQLKDSA